MSRWLTRLARRTSQALGLLLLVALPLASLYTHYKEAHAINDLPATGWRNVVMRGIDSWVGRDAGRRQLVESTQGTVWSARLGGWSVTDPLAGAEAIVASRSFYRPLLWSLLVPLVVTLILGRVFCGWFCPMNTILEIVDKARRLLRIAEIRERDVKFSLRNKYVLLAATLVIVAATGAPFIALVYPPAMLSREMHTFVFASTVGVGAYVLLAICAIELLVSKRWWCRYMCPGGALYSLLGRFRLVRVVRDERKCVSCGDCVRICQFDLRPMLVQITGMECTNCGSCIRGCDSDALHYRLVLPLPGSGSQQPSDKAPPAIAHGQKPMEEPVARGATTTAIVVCLALANLVAPPLVQAHHILGLPHYSYKENYPQAPTLEYPATTGPYDVLMTSFPGKPVPGERAAIAFYIKNRNTDQPYEPSVTLRVLKTKTFGENEVVFPVTTHDPSGNQHKFMVVFPDDGEYVAELSLEVEGKIEVIPFLMVAGTPSATKSVLIVIGVGLGVFFLTVRAIKKKRDRRRAASPALPEAIDHHDLPSSHVAHSQEVTASGS